jgi:hypothetical protein
MRLLLRRHKYLKLLRERGVGYQKKVDLFIHFLDLIIHLFALFIDLLDLFIHLFVLFIEFQTDLVIE